MEEEQDITTQDTLNGNNQSITGMPASQLPGNTSVAMTPQEIFDTYNVLAGQVQQYADANAMRAAQAQASYGPLAERVMGGSRTAGLGNYTYNRAIRPNLNSLTASLKAQGVSAALNRQLSEALNQAKSNYDSSYTRYSTKGSGSNKNNDGGVDIDEENTDPDKPNGSVSLTPSTANSNEANAGSAKVPLPDGSTADRIVTKYTKKQQNPLIPWQKDDVTYYHIQGVGTYRDGTASWEDAKNRYQVSLRGN